MTTEATPKATPEAPIVIKNRQELIFILSEAAQLEHMLMCEYLFAAFSLKRNLDEGLTADQLAKISSWERTITGVATQEMLHMALVNNLLTAIGGAPFLGRPNFPQRSKYYAPHVQLVLLPFGEEALRHFLYLERPEGMDIKDAPGFEVIEEAPVPVVTDGLSLVPVGQNFMTVGHLYRGIEQALRDLVANYGEKQVFLGAASLQADQSVLGWQELIPVTDLASAIKAIETILDQGEGARGHWEKAHYGRFYNIANEYTELKRQDSSFQPARPATATFTRPPSDMSDVVLATDPFTAEIEDLFNASYETMLQILVRFFIHEGETAAEFKALIDLGVDMMFSVIKPLGIMLTRLPVGPEQPGKTAGPSFEIFRTGYILPHRYAAWTILQERLQELAGSGSEIAQLPAAQLYQTELAAVTTSLNKYAATIAQYISADQLAKAVN